MFDAKKQSLLIAPGITCDAPNFPKTSQDISHHVYVL